MVKAPKNIIKELENLVNSEKIPAVGLFAEEQLFKYEPINHYTKAISIGTKPETASHELFRELVRDILNRESFSEVNVGTGFVDFALRETNGNPILIELKPLFKLLKSREILKPEKLDFRENEAQIQKYLQRNQYDYIVLTNLKEAYLFNRDSRIKFEPFETISFTELLYRLAEHDNIWDTIRRIEDQQEKIDLDESFFKDLKNWYNEFREIKFIDNDRFSKEELIVLLLNKIFFIKTLDDLALIQFNHLVDEYLNKKSKWEAKGSAKILSVFFNELEEYFDDFYDTELFKHRFWDYVDKSKENTDIFMNIFETALGLDPWNRAFGRGILHYNYRKIDEDIFGKAYETFIAEHKKDSGIFYTPKEITQYMSKKSVDYLFEPLIEKILIALDKDKFDVDKADELMEQLYSIKIIDTASGSGSFLIKILREVYLYYQEIEKATSWVNNISSDNFIDMPENFRQTNSFRKKHNLLVNEQLKLISKIILRHIYAADIDERALDTAKTNIWKEAIKLNPKIYNYRKLNGESSHILPNLELNFINGDSLADLPIAQQLEIISNNHKTDIVLLHEIRNNYLQNPFDQTQIDRALEIKKNIYETLKPELPQTDKPVFFCLEFFYCFFSKEGNILEESEQGFDSVISNPPWETIKPIEKEFAGKTKGELDILDFKKWFKKELESNAKWAEDWESYKKFYEDYNDFLSTRYFYQNGGDHNYYKFFLERNLEILKKDGILNILIPSGIQTDSGCADLRKLITSKYLLQEIDSFENRGYKRNAGGIERNIKLFPEVDSRFKFSIVNIVKTPAHPFMTINAKFYMLDPKELVEKESIEYNLETLKKFSPENLSIMEFRSQKDYSICEKIRNEHTLLGALDYKFSTEFHMTNDSNYFHKYDEVVKRKDEKKVLPLFEGKMIHQYSSSYSSPRFYVYEKEARNSFFNSEYRKLKREYKLSDDVIKRIKIQLDYDDYRLAYRAVASSTNERTIISSIVPPKVFIGHSMNYLTNSKYTLTDKEVVVQIINSASEKIILLTLLNSLTLNYYIRNKISANLTMNFMYELPIPQMTSKQKEYLIKSGFTLLYEKSEKKLFTKLKKQLGIEAEKNVDTINLRAELELYIAKQLYGLDNKDWRYITSTFIYGSSATKEELDKIIEYSLNILK